MSYSNVSLYMRSATRSCNFHKMLHRYLVLNSHAQLKHLKQISVMNSCFQPQKIFRALFPSLSFNGRFNVLLFVL